MMANKFGATSTTEDVLSGVNLQGKRILVTGVSAGLGVETARALAAHGAHVVGAARDVVKAETSTAQVRKDAAAQGGSFELVTLDLASLKSVRACATELIAKGEPFDLVIANAGVMATPLGQTVDGFETQFGTNHLGHFVLINRIAPLMRAGSRLINLASSGHRFANVDLQDPNFDHTPYEPGRHMGREQLEAMVDQINKQEAAQGRGPFQWKTIPQGAATSVWAGVVAPADEIGGRYCENCHVGSIVADNVTISPISEGVRGYALDPGTARALWQKSEEMVGESFA
jgi:NAD(P)-dependent dehydrogenase (short-subunit alcohol dehydrogenase family)